MFFEKASSTHSIFNLRQLICCFLLRILGERRPTRDQRRTGKENSLTLPWRWTPRVSTQVWVKKTMFISRLLNILQNAISLVATCTQGFKISISSARLGLQRALRLESRLRRVSKLIIKALYLLFHHLKLCCLCFRAVSRSQSTSGDLAR